MGTRKFFTQQDSSTKQARSKRKTLSGFLQGLGMILATAIIVVLISNNNTGQTYALMSSSVTVNAGTINTGTESLTIENVTNYTFSGLAVNQLLPGRSTVTAAPLTLKNTGTTPITVTMGAATFSSGPTALTTKLQFAVKQTPTCTITADGQPFPTANPTISLAVGQSLPICIEIGLKSDADSSVQGQSATFTIPLNATQVRL